jgi:hypothetical protein
MPAENKRSQKRSNKDANDDVAIEIHGQQHDEIGDCELQHV